MSRAANWDDYAIEPFESTHDRTAFSCGQPALDEHLRTRISQDIKRRAVAAFVLRPKDSAQVIGYYTLSSLGVPLDDFPDARKLPRYPVLPVTLIGRLALDTRWHRLGLGELLLTDALHRSLRQCREVGSCAVVVDAKDPKAAEFYTHHEFIAFPDHSLRLFLPMATIVKIFEAAEEQAKKSAKRSR